MIYERRRRFPCFVSSSPSPGSSPRSPTSSFLQSRPPPLSTLSAVPPTPPSLWRVSSPSPTPFPCSCVARRSSPTTPPNPSKDPYGSFIIEDLVTSSALVLETAAPLREEGLEARDAVVVLDRKQEGKDKLNGYGINLHSLVGVGEMVEVLVRNGRVSEEKAREAREFLEENTMVGVPVAALPAPKPWVRVLYRERVGMVRNLTGRWLMVVLEMKESNFWLAADALALQE